MKEWKRDFESPGRSILQRDLLKAGSESSFELKKNSRSPRSSMIGIKSPLRDQRPSVASFAIASNSSLTKNESSTASNQGQTHARSKSVCVDLISQPLVLSQLASCLPTSIRTGPLGTKTNHQETSIRSEADEKLIKKYLGDYSITERPGGRIKNEWSSSLANLTDEKSEEYRNFNLKKVKGPVEIKLDLSQDKQKAGDNLEKKVVQDLDSSMNLQKSNYCGPSKLQSESLPVSSNTKLSFSKEALEKLGSSIRQFRRDSGRERSSDFNSYVTKRKTRGSPLKLKRLHTEMAPIKEDNENHQSNKNLETRNEQGNPDETKQDESLTLGISKKLRVPSNITFGKLSVRDLEKFKNKSSLNINSRRSNLRLSEIRNLRKVDKYQ